MRRRGKIGLNKIYCGDALDRLKVFPDGFIDCCVTSPPYYGLRDYGVNGQIGLEETPEAYIEKLVAIFREVRRVLKDDGTLWLNLGDSYAGSRGNGKIKQSVDQNKFIEFDSPTYKLDELKDKDLIGIPWMVAFALRADGWYLRQDIIWSKSNPMPESVKDRCTKSHEYIFLLSKSKNYYYDYKAISEKSEWFEKDKRSKYGRVPHKSGKSLLPESQYAIDGVGYSKDGLRNKRSVWNVNTKPFKDAHFAVFPKKLIMPCIKAGCRENGIVLDPFMGAGTTALVARQLERNYIGIELSKKFIELANNRLRTKLGLFL